MAREDPQLKLRLPVELKARIEAAASTSGRSINAEIVQRLEASFPAASSFGSPAQMGEYRDLAGRLLGERQQKLLALMAEDWAGMTDFDRGVLSVRIERAEADVRMSEETFGLLERLAAGSVDGQ